MDQGGDNLQRASGAGPRLRLGVGPALILVALLTVAAAATVTHLLWRETANRNVLDVADQLNDEIIAGVRREVADLVERTEATQEAIRQVFAKGTIDLEDKERRSAFYLALLRANPHVSWISFGYPNGDFFGAQRRDNVNFRLVDSLWDPTARQATRTIDYYVDDGHETYFTHRKVKQNDYYAPGRHWYQAAIEREDAVWTDVYRFASSRKPGVNTAVRLSLQGEPQGVISIAIELDRLSHYLKSLSVGERGIAALLNGSGELIAFQDHEPIGREDEAAATLPRLDSARDALLLAVPGALDAARLTLAEIDGRRQVQHRLERGGERVFVTLEPVGLNDWLVATVVPEADFLTRVERNIEHLLGLLIPTVLLVATAAALIARAVFGRPLAQLVEQIGRVERFELEQIERVPSAIGEIDRLSEAVERTRQGLAAFGRYLPVDLVRTLIQQGKGVEIGGETRTLSILFMDLEGFTSQAEALGPRLLPYLSDYLGDMSGQIGAHDGTIDKYIGDGIMAFWGAPIHDEDHAVKSCRAAVHCLRLLDMRRIEWANQNRPAFNLRIGLNSGRVIVGNVGSPEKLDYTALGDPVNLAARLEALNKVYGTRIIIGPQTHELAKYDIVARRLDAVTVKGKSERVTVFELVAMRDEVDPGMGFDWIEAYERGLDLMEQRNWAGAIERFLRAIDLRGGDDPPSALMIERCRARGNAPESDSSDARAALPDADSAA